jgi:uncharacterized membrane protein
MMNRRIRAAIGATLLAVAPLAASAQQTQQPTPKKHHSVLKGAVAGAVAGHMTHHKHGALAGAAVGAAIQHHRNAKASSTTP